MEQPKVKILRTVLIFLASIGVVGFLYNTLYEQLPFVDSYPVYPSGSFSYVALLLLGSVVWYLGNFISMHARHPGFWHLSMSKIFYTTLLVLVTPFGLFGAIPISLAAVFLWGVFVIGDLGIIFTPESFVLLPLYIVPISLVSFIFISGLQHSNRSGALILTQVLRVLVYELGMYLIAMFISGSSYI